MRPLPIPTAGAASRRRTSARRALTSLNWSTPRPAPPSSPWAPVSPTTTIPALSAISTPPLYKPPKGLASQSPSPSRTTSPQRCHCPPRHERSGYELRPEYSLRRGQRHPNPQQNRAPPARHAPQALPSSSRLASLIAVAPRCGRINRCTPAGARVLIAEAQRHTMAPRDGGLTKSTTHSVFSKPGGHENPNIGASRGPFGHLPIPSRSVQLRTNCFAPGAGTGQTLAFRTPKLERMALVAIGPESQPQGGSRGDRRGLYRRPRRRAPIRLRAFLSSPASPSAMRADPNPERASMPLPPQPISSTPLPAPA